MAARRLLASDPVRSLDDHRRAGGLKALEDALAVEPEAIISTVTDAGLRGRGGAGFPTGQKWSTVRTNAASSELAPTVVVNAAEGEPGTFGDRTIIRHNPYRVVEGAVIAAHAVGARGVSIVTKDRFALEADLLETAANDVVTGGFAGGIDVDVVRGPSHYLLGEETALLEVVLGRPPFPRVVPPYRQGTVEIGDAGGPAGMELAGDGGLAPPTLVNNVETLAHVPQIVENGPDWFRELGTEDSPGTSIFTVTGDVKRAGVGEFPLGTPVGEIIEELSGGLTSGEVSFVLSGVANGILTGDQLHTPATHAAMRDAGSGLGTGGFIVFSTDTDPISVAAGVSRFLGVESCGQCRPCKLGGLEVAEWLEFLREGEARDDIVEWLVTRVASVPEGARCDLGRQHERVILSLLENFGEVALAHAVDKISSPPVLIAPIVDIDEVGRVQLDERQAEKNAGWHYGGEWNGQSPAEATDTSVMITPR